MGGSGLAPCGALPLRVAMGVLFLAHGLYLKVFVFTMARTVGFFESVGFPGFLAWIVMLAETVGGILLVLGLYARLVALAMIPLLLGAASVHFPNGWVFSNPNGGREYPIVWTVCPMVRFLIGDGVLAMRRPGTRA
jgi:putative oxidoreductase